MRKASYSAKRFDFASFSCTGGAARRGAEGGRNTYTSLAAKGLRRLKKKGGKNGISLLQVKLSAGHPFHSTASQLDLFSCLSIFLKIIISVSPPTRGEGGAGRVSPTDSLVLGSIRPSSTLFLPPCARLSIYILDRVVFRFCSAMNCMRSSENHAKRQCYLYTQLLLQLLLLLPLLLLQKKKRKGRRDGAVYGNCYGH